MGQVAKVFLCYAKEDRERIESLYHKLNSAGFAPWMDKIDLIGGQDWSAVTQQAIRNSHFFIACVSKHWGEGHRRYFRREISVALDVLPELQQGDIYIIPIRLEECHVPESLSLFHWIDYFHNDGWQHLLRALYLGIDKLGLMKPIRLRTEPALLSHEDVSVMLDENEFFDSYANAKGKGICHGYESRGSVVIDRPTDLMWQRNSSSRTMNHAEAGKYVQQLNEEKFANYHDWRLPTLVEVMSLMEPREKHGEWHIDPVFDDKKAWIWTADKKAAGVAWRAGFGHGYCSYSNIDDLHYVRAVRSISPQGEQEGQSII